MEDEIDRLVGLSGTHTLVLGVGETLTFVMVDAHSLLLGVAAAHTYGLVEDDTHASVLEGTGVHTTMLGAIFVVLVFCEVVTSFTVGLII